MGKIKIIFIETALELVPKEIIKNKNIKSNKISYKDVLDISLHYKEMLRLKDFKKRGRPDIIHHSLLNILEKPFVINGEVDVYMHVYDGRVFKFSNDIRLPKNYDRFKGLMSQLLLYNKVPPNEEKPLIYLVSSSLNEFLNDRKIILLTENGVNYNLDNLINLALEKKMPIGIGGFAHGDFSEDTKKYAYKQISLFNGYNFKSWDITCFISSKLMERIPLK